MINWSIPAPILTPEEGEGYAHPDSYCFRSRPLGPSYTFVEEHGEPCSLPAHEAKTVINWSIPDPLEDTGGERGLCTPGFLLAPLKAARAKLRVCGGARREW